MKKFLLLGVLLSSAAPSCAAYELQYSGVFYSNNYGSFPIAGELSIDPFGHYIPFSFRVSFDDVPLGSALSVLASSHDITIGGLSATGGSVRFGYQKSGVRRLRGLGLEVPGLGSGTDFNFTIYFKTSNGRPMGNEALVSRGSEYVFMEKFSFDNNTLYVSPELLSGAVTPPPPSVPEPATWAMMIAGFGMVGAALRARPQRVPIA